VRDHLQIRIAATRLSGEAAGYEQFDIRVPPYFSRNSTDYGEGGHLEPDRIP
jgi:hypothetical protein